MPSSREDVDKDSLWNQWLRNEIHNVFVEALDTFKVCTFQTFTRDTNIKYPQLSTNFAIKLYKLFCTMTVEVFI